MEPRELATEPISPELALVDPDLAARARDGLPEHPWPAPVRFELPPDARRAPRDGTPLAATLWTLGFGLAVALFVFGLTVVSTGDRPTFAAEVDASPAAASPPAATRRTPLARFRPARLFSWPPHAGAVYYQVTFLRKGQPLYRTRARGARLRLPDRVRFTPGRYRWTVRPAIATDLGIRLADPVVDATFRVRGD